jgi:hypothetical protein
MAAQCRVPREHGTRCAVLPGRGTAPSHGTVPWKCRGRVWEGCTMAARYRLPRVHGGMRYYQPAPRRHPAGPFRGAVKRCCAAALRRGAAPQRRCGRRSTAVPTRGTNAVGGTRRTAECPCHPNIVFPKQIPVARHHEPIRADTLTRCWCACVDNYGEEEFTGDQGISLAFGEGPLALAKTAVIGDSPVKGGPG